MLYHITHPLTSPLFVLRCTIWLMQLQPHQIILYYNICIPYYMIILLLIFINYIMSCYITSLHIISYHIASHRVILHRIVQYHIISSCLLPYDISLVLLAFEIIKYK